LGIHKSQKLPFKFAIFFKPDIYIGVSEESCIWAKDKWKISPSNVYLFINLPKLAFIELFERNFNQIINPIDESKYFPEFKSVCVGNIKKGKNQLFAIELAKELDFNLTLIGTNQDSLYYKKIIASLNKKIELNENCYNTEDILMDYNLALMVSENESGPLVLMEYLLAGLPFIAYKTGGISEVLFKYFPDFFIDNFDISIWKERITQFMYNPPVIDKIKVKEIVDKEFNREIYFNQLMRIYESQ